MISSFLFRQVRIGSEENVNHGAPVAVDHHGSRGDVRWVMRAGERNEGTLPGPRGHQIHRNVRSRAAQGPREGADPPLVDGVRQFHRPPPPRPVHRLPRKDRGGQLPTTVQPEEPEPRRESHPRHRNGLPGRPRPTAHPQPSRKSPPTPAPRTCPSQAPPTPRPPRQPPSLRLRHPRHQGPVDGQGREIRGERSMRLPCQLEGHPPAQAGRCARLPIRGAGPPRPAERPGRPKFLRQLR